MDIKTHTITRYIKETVTEYVAENGERFQTEQECIEYEELLKKAYELEIDNPQYVLPYDTYVTECNQYLWVNLKSDEDFEIIKKVYNTDVDGLDYGIYCIEVRDDGEAYITSIEDSVVNALRLLEFAGYDISTLKNNI